MPLSSRNLIPGFAARTRKNLDFIISSQAQGADVHVVTQLMLSLLGLIVFPKEKGMDARIANTELSKLVRQGWPQLFMEGEECKTLGRTIEHLRNAISHRHVEFSSNSRDLSEVSISFEDYWPGESTPYWKGKIDAQQLRDFCYRFIDLMNESLS